MRWLLWLDSDSNETSTALVHHIVIVDHRSKTRLLRTFSPHLTHYINVLMNGISSPWVHVSSSLGAHFAMFWLRVFFVERKTSSVCSIPIVVLQGTVRVPTHTVCAKVLGYKIAGFQQFTVAHFLPVPVTPFSSFVWERTAVHQYKN